MVQGITPGQGLALELKWSAAARPSLLGPAIACTLQATPGALTPTTPTRARQGGPTLLASRNTLPPGAVRRLQGSAAVQEKLRAPTTQGRKLRRTLLKGSVAVIIVAGYEGKRFIYERMKELGIRWGGAGALYSFWEFRGQGFAFEHVLLVFELQGLVAGCLCQRLNLSGWGRGQARRPQCWLGVQRLGSCRGP